MDFKDKSDQSLDKMYTDLKSASEQTNFDSTSDSLDFADDESNKSRHSSSHRSSSLLPKNVNYKGYLQNKIDVLNAELTTLQDQQAKLIASGKYDKAKELQEKIDNKISDLDDVYTKKSKTFHLDKKDQLKDIKNKESFYNKTANYYEYMNNESEEDEDKEENSNKSKKYKDKESTTVKEHKKASDKEETKTSKTRSKVREFRQNSALSRAANKLSNNKLTNAFKDAGKKILNAIKSFFKFLVTPPVGWVLLALLLILFIDGIALGSMVPSDNSLEDTTMQNEYRAWISVFNDKSTEFYNKYHTAVSGSNLAPIYYTFKDDRKYDELVNKYYDDLSQDDYETREEFELDVYKNAVTDYQEDLDVYEMRELFLDKVNYSYSYLARIWTNWITIGSPSDTINEGTMSSYEANMESMAKQHDEYDSFASRVRVRYRHEESHEEVDKKTGKTKKVIDKVWYTYQNESCTRWKYRDVQEEYWVTNMYDENVETDSNRSTLNPNTNFEALENYHTEYVTENGVSKPWEYHYIENSKDRIVKRIRYWSLRTRDDVYDDIINLYNPITEEEDYIGDDFTLHKQDDVYGEVEIPINKKKIYVDYYLGETAKYIFQENYFTEQNCLDIITQIQAYQQLFSSLLCLDIQMYPDFENTEAWKHSSEGGTNNAPYGQCTWFAAGMFYQNYGFELGPVGEAWGNGNQLAETLVKAHPDMFELSDTPKVGAIFSKGIGATYGHTGMIVADNGDGTYIIAEGNFNGETDPWEVAIVDWEVREVSMDYFKTHTYKNDSGEFPYIFANPIG